MRLDAKTKATMTNLILARDVTSMAHFVVMLHVFDVTTHLPATA